MHLELAHLFASKVATVLLRGNLALSPAVDTSTGAGKGLGCKNTTITLQGL